MGARPRVAVQAADQCQADIGVEAERALVAGGEHACRRLEHGFRKPAEQHARDGGADTRGKHRAGRVEVDVGAGVGCEKECGNRT
ncbi:MAG: hypothetical protein WDN04_03925 [Rhodospirillales bacterium]